MYFFNGEKESKSRCSVAQGSLFQQKGHPCCMLKTSLLLAQELNCPLKIGHESIEIIFYCSFSRKKIIF